MRRPRLCPLFVRLTALCGFLPPSVCPSWGGAWLLPPGEGQIITDALYSVSTWTFDSHGKLISAPSYQKYELSPYIEFGVTDWLTLVAAPAYDLVRTPTAGLSYTGVGQSEVAARLGLAYWERAVLSMEVGLLSPGASLDSIGPLEVRRAASLDVRGLAGRSFAVGDGMEGFVEMQAGYRFYAQQQPGEWRIDFTGGLRPFPWLLLLLQDFNVISYGWSQYGSVSWSKLQPGIVYDVSPQWSMQIGGFLTVAGVNAGREIGPLAAIWYRF
ncbi:MAG TPA: hypothetical protein VME69_10575 [Methylocella sp.]|nr:hypothetical protein [Methylocella sp.]